MSGLPADVLAKIERQIAEEDSDDPNRTRRNR
jgi:hypothetical protein